MTVLPSPLTIYSGQTTFLRITILNSGRLPVESLEVEPPTAEGSSPPTVELDLDKLESALPLQPGQITTVRVKLTGVVDTAVSSAILRPEDSVSVASDTRWSLASSTANTRSLTTTTGHLSLASQASHGSLGDPVPLQLVFKLEYAGSDNAWCRRATIPLSLIQVPSLQVRNFANYGLRTLREILLNLHGPAINSNLSFHCFMYDMFLILGDAMGRTSW